MKGSDSDKKPRRSKMSSESCFPSALHDCAQAEVARLAAELEKVSAGVDDAKASDVVVDPQRCD